MSGVLRCAFCKEEISGRGKCSCEENVNASHIEACKHSYNLQFQQIIKHCIDAGVPSPSQFPINVTFEVRIEGKHKRVYNVQSIGSTNFVQMKIDTRWFSDYQSENGWSAVNSHDKSEDNNKVSSSESDCNGQHEYQTELLVENSPALSEDGNPRQHSAERDNNNGQQHLNESEETLNSEMSYNLPLRVRFHVANYTTLEIIFPRLDWHCLLQDLDSNKADLAWHFYLEKAPRSDVQVVVHDKDKDVSSNNSKDGEVCRCLDNGCAKLIEGDAWCSICHSSIIEMGELKQPLQLPCGHAYHSNCIVKWLVSKSTCPLCRYQIPI